MPFPATWVLPAAGRVLVSDGVSQLAVIDPTTGKALATLNGTQVPVNLADATVAAGLLVGRAGPEVLAFDPATLKVRFRFVPRDAPDIDSFVAVEADGVLAVAISAPDRDAADLLGLNPATGAVLWRREIPQVHRFGLAGGRTVLFEGTDDLFAFDPQTGKPRWHARRDDDVPSHELLAVDRSRAVIAADERKLAVRDAWNGARGRKLAFPQHRFLRVALLDGVAVCAVEQVHTLSRAPRMLAGFDLGRGSLLWRSPLPAPDDPSAPPFVRAVVLDGLFYSLSPDGELRALDRFGHERWSFGLGGASDFAVLRTAQGPLAVAAVDGELWGLPVSGMAQTTRVTLRGRVVLPPELATASLQGLLISAGTNKPARVRRDGSFALTVNGRGFATLHASGRLSGAGIDPAKSCVLGSLSTSVPLEASADREVEVPAVGEECPR